MTEEAPQKKKLPVIGKRIVSESNMYTPSEGTMHYAFVSSPETGRIRATAFMTCREYFNRAFQSGVTKANCDHHYPKEDAPIDKEKLRLLIYSHAADIEAYKNRLFNAKAVLNVLEDFAEFGERSKISTVKHEGCKHVWLITGPKEWQEHPQLLSLATLILRIVARYGPINTESFETVEKDLKTLSEKPNTDGNDIPIHLRLVWDKIYIILKYRKEIFEGIEEKYAYDKHAESFYSESGISRFTTVGVKMYNGKVEKAKAKYLALCAEHLPRKK